MRHGIWTVQLFREVPVGLMRTSRTLCFLNAFGMMIALPGLNDDIMIQAATAWMLATGLGWMLFDREIRREMASRE